MSVSVARSNPNNQTATHAWFGVLTVTDFHHFKFSILKSLFCLMSFQCLLLDIASRPHRRSWHTPPPPPPPPPSEPSYLYIQVAARH
ncbi:uncharacterized protein LY89DRAFT_95863 [Mollisia scopiformis]|uniref:Uncharacterized protein n=1 Tax=Mollisia scopiformis TaxID=149040 RepID=A0A194X6H0_MOLSC|nr:uncharacterized protein LY89DRAFT_95863 [Mollisia scopiformis]KUJ15781.1 hypothetical protein LY89DRAFT_95863 [Mollisia scopiformis]